MMTSWNGNIFRVTGHLCGEFTDPGDFPAQRPVTRSFDVFFDLRLNKRFSKQSWGWWFETPSRPLWRHRNGSRIPCSATRSASPTHKPADWQLDQLYCGLHGHPAEVITIKLHPACTASFGRHHEPLLDVARLCGLRCRLPGQRRDRPVWSKWSR